MATNPRWTPTWGLLFVFLAAICFFLAALSFHGDLSGANGSTILSIGLFFLALAIAF